MTPATRHAAVVLAAALPCFTGCGSQRPHQEVALHVLPNSPIRLSLDPTDRVISPAIRTRGVWEDKETHWFTRAVRKGATVVDVGAHIGYYTLIAGKLVGDSGRVYAFEPAPDNYELLEHNIRINALRNVVAEQKAVADKAGKLRLHLADKNKGDHRIYQTAEARVFVDVPAVSLDDYFASNSNPIDFVKIDTQGAEVVILRGMHALIERNKNLVMALEFCPSNLDGLGNTGAECLAILKSHDFLFYDLSSGDIASLAQIGETELLARNTVENKQATDLLLVKGRAEQDRLSAQVEAAAKALERATRPQRTLAQRDLDQARRALQDYQERLLARFTEPNK